MADEQAVTAETTAPTSPVEETNTSTEPAEKPVQTPEEKDARAYQAERQARQIDELKAEIEGLKADRVAESALQDFGYTSPAQVPPVSQQQFVDPNTGYFDVGAYDRNLKEQMAKVRAEAAIQAAQAARSEAERVRQEEKVLAKYPELDPKGQDYDPDFYEAVNGAIISRQRSGKAVNYVEVADRVRGMSDKRIKAATEAATEQAVEEQSKKEAAGTVAPQGANQSGRAAAQEAVDSDQLRKETVGASYGHNRSDLAEVIGQRLSKIPHKGE